MTVILTSTNYQDVRVILNVTSDDITDTDFNTFGLVTLVNAYLSRYVPDYSQLTGNNAVNAMSAAVYMTAALSTTIIQLKNSKAYKLGDYEESNSRNVDWDKLREYFFSMSRQFLGLLTTLTLTRPSIFAVAGKVSSGLSEPQTFENWYKRIAPQLVRSYEGYANINPVEEI